VSTARTRRGGWVDRKRQRVCRWCGGAVPKGRFTFCSPVCVHQWRLRTDPSYLREQVFARDRGICAACGVDTAALRKEFRKLDYRTRREFLKEWKLEEGWRRSLWDADHIVPVAEGGGECDLSNMRTLCLKCHRQVTVELRRRMSRHA
jgi:5-methylcytosine-specific restriction protein A